MTSWPYSRSCRTVSIGSGRAGGLAGELPPRAGGLRDAVLENEDLLQPRPVAHGGLEDSEQPARREPGVDEVVRQVGTPLIEPGTIQDVIARRLPGIEQVAVGVMLVLLPPRIAPVVIGPRDESQSEVAKILLRLRKIGAFETRSP
jgi:hypothetical protein